MMKFENWVNETFNSPSLNQVFSQHSSHQNQLKKLQKALHMADSLLGCETVLEIAPGRFSGFGDSVLFVTSQRLLIIKNSFQSGHSVSLNFDSLENARLSYQPLAGHTLSLDGGTHRFTRIPADFANSLRKALFEEQKTFSRIFQAD